MKCYLVPDCIRTRWGTAFINHIGRKNGNSKLWKTHGKHLPASHFHTFPPLEDHGHVILPVEVRHNKEIYHQNEIGRIYHQKLLPRVQVGWVRRFQLGAVPKKNQHQRGCMELTFFMFNNFSISHLYYKTNEKQNLSASHEKPFTVLSNFAGIVHAIPVFGRLEKMWEKNYLYWMLAWTWTQNHVKRIKPETKQVGERASQISEEASEYGWVDHTKIQIHWTVQDENLCCGGSDNETVSPTTRQNRGNRGGRNG